MLSRDHLTPDAMAANTRPRAVLIVDLCGFTRTVRAEGLAGFLARVVSLREEGAYIVAKHGGDLVKCDADNVYALFATVDEALKAARMFHLAPFPLSAGIDVGPVLRVPGDLWGDAVNTASKLGEDLAGAGETILSSRAAGQCALRLAPPKERIWDF